MTQFSLSSLRWALLLAFLFGASACGDGEEPPTPAAPDTAEAATATAPPADTAQLTAPASADTAKITVEDFQFRLEEGTRYFSGVLYNPTSEPIESAQIQIALLNANNVRVGTAEVTVKNVPPGGRKPFREPLASGKENIDAADVQRVLVPVF